MFSFYFLFYFIALVISLIHFKKFVDTPLRFFPLLIAYTLFNEVLGYFILYFEEFSFFDEEEYNWHNVIIYNVYKIFFFGYLFWLYHRLIRRKNHQRLVKIGVAACLLSYVVTLFFLNPLHSDLYYADSIACFILISVIIIHFKEIRHTNGGINRYNLMVWISFGLLIFSFYFPYYLLNGYLNVEFFLKYNLRQILWGVVSTMYLLFIIGFIISKRSAFR